jgi:hypothetical protein
MSTSLFPTHEASLNTNQVCEIEKLMKQCQPYSIGFSIFNDAKGKTQYWAVLYYTDLNKKPKSATFTKPSFGEVVAEVYQKIQTINTKKA